MKKPRRAALGSLIAFDANNNKSTETLRKYRTALNFIWKKVPKARDVMLACGFKAPGDYLATNQHTGLCFALPREVPGPARFSDVDAGWILRHCYEAGGTVSQCQSVSKLLSYAYEAFHLKLYIYIELMCLNCHILRFSNTQISLISSSWTNFLVPRATYAS